MLDWSGMGRQGLHAQGVRYHKMGVFTDDIFVTLGSKNT